MIESSYDSGYHYAQAIQMECPSLQYIHIGQYAWQVMRYDLRPSHVPKDFNVSRLRRLYHDEMSCVELFDLTASWRQGGLPHVQRPPRDLSDAAANQHKEISDEEHRRWEEMVAEDESESD